MKRCGFEQRPDVGAGDRAHRDGRVVRAEHRRASLADAAVERARDDRDAVDVAGLALIGAEAERGVALDVLDRLEALAHGLLDAGGRHVVLEVDELLGRAARRLDVRRDEQRHRLRARRVRAARGGHALRAAGAVAGLAARDAPVRRDRQGLGGGAARHGRRLAARAEAVAQALGQAVVAEHAAAVEARLDARRRRHEAERLVAPGRPTARVAGQVHRRTPAAGGGDGVALEQPHVAGHEAGARVDGRHQRAAHALGAERLHDDRARDDADAGLERLVDDARLGIPSRVHDRGDLAPGARPGERRPVAAVVGGADHEGPARHDGEALDVLAHRVGRHAARHVVVAEHERALVRAAGEHDRARADAVQAVARLAGAGALAEAVAGALPGGGEVVIVQARERGVGQPHDVRGGVELGDGRRHPVHRRAPVDRLAAGEQPAAGLGALVDQQHAHAAPRRGERRGEPRRTRPDDQRVHAVVQRARSDRDRAAPARARDPPRGG